jgi:hypothetical protein
MVWIAKKNSFFGDLTFTSGTHKAQSSWIKWLFSWAESHPAKKQLENPTTRNNFPGLA